MTQSLTSTIPVSYPEGEDALTHPDFHSLLEKWIRALANLAKKAWKMTLKKARHFLTRLQHQIDESAEIHRRLTRAREARYARDFYHWRGVL